MPLLVAGWSGLGLVLAFVLVCRGHERRTTMAVGAGLGPLMAVVVADVVRFREPEVRPCWMDPGTDRGGPLDVVVVLDGHGDSIDAVVPTLTAVRADLGSVSLVRVVPFEWLEAPSPELEVVSEELAAARDRLAFGDVALVAVPGRRSDVRRRLERTGRSCLVLHAAGGCTVDGRHH